MGAYTEMEAYLEHYSIYAKLFVNGNLRAYAETNFIVGIGHRWQHVINCASGPPQSSYSVNMDCPHPVVIACAIVHVHTCSVHAVWMGDGRCEPK